MLTGLAIGVAILTIISLGNVATSNMLFAIAILGSYEISRMMHPDRPGYVSYLHIFIGSLPFLFLQNVILPDLNILILIGITCAFFLYLIFDLYKLSYIEYSKWSYLFVFLYWGMSFGLGAYVLRNASDYNYTDMIGIILMIWTSDTMAYFTGRKFGKNKLFPSVSPNKTREGSLGAGIFCIILAFIIAYFLQQPLIKWIAIAIIMWVIGTYGDLVESKMKRYAGVKDSGNLLPGHGGFLDRFDSLALAIPFLLLLSYLDRWF